MADFDIIPKIADDDFNSLFEMKRYFLADLSSILARARIEKDELYEAAHRVDANISKSTVRALKRNEPVSLAHAEAFATAINEILDAKGLSKEKYESSDAIHAAFFIIDGLHSELESRSITVSALANEAGYNATVIEAAKQGYRLTLSTALDIIRTVNALSSDENDGMNPLSVLVTDATRGRRAAAKGCRAFRNTYLKWPPDTLLDIDQPSTGNLGNVRQLRRER